MINLIMSVLALVPAAQADDQLFTNPVNWLEAAGDTSTVSPDWNAQGQLMGYDTSNAEVLEVTSASGPPRLMASYACSDEQDTGISLQLQPDPWDPLSFWLQGATNGLTVVYTVSDGGQNRTVTHVVTTGKSGIVLGSGQLTAITVSDTDDNSDVCVTSLTIGD